MRDHAERDRIAERLALQAGIPDRDLATAVWLMESLSRPLLLEGEAGVGKTEVALTLARANDTRLIRLQCYEGSDQNAALYEWNYQRQLLAIKAQESHADAADVIEDHIFLKSFCWNAPFWRRSVSPSHLSC